MYYKKLDFMWFLATPTFALKIEHPEYKNIILYSYYYYFLFIV